MDLRTQYQSEVATGEITADPLQLEALAELQIILDALGKARLLPRIFHRSAPKPVKGLYLYGGVGIGKTYLMDLFFDALPLKNKLRLHSHQFMQTVHHLLREHQGKVDPLKSIAQHFSKKTRVLCLDEFIVSEIADAMILAGLLDALFQQGVCLITTSNTAPDELYKNGLQRARFLPAIDLIKKHTHAFHLTSLADYRLKALEKTGVYFSPLSSDSEQALQTCFQQVTHGQHISQDPLFITNRGIAVKQRSHEVLWFEFEVICNVPRSKNDYIEIAKSYNTVFVSNIPKLSKEQSAQATYLIHLVDVFYDCKVKLLVSAATSIDGIYTEGNLLPSFERTKSRLIEMQSRSYLHEAHKVL